jgi:hypothetical protein
MHIVDLNTWFRIMDDAAEWRTETFDHAVKGILKRSGVDLYYNIICVSFA